MIRRRTSWHRLAFGSLTLLAATALVAAACGDDDDEDDAADTAPTTAATRAAAAPTIAAATTPAADETAAGADTTPAADGETPGTSAEIGTTSLGQVLTDPDGLTLYVFANDTAGGSSACTGQCTAVWLPHTITGEPVAPEGADGEFATITRDDGTSQLTYKGLPLYRFVNDTAAGQTNGEGVANLWTVARP